MSITAEWLESVLEEDESGKKIEGVVKLSCEPAAGPNENFTSCVYRVKAEVRIEGGASRTLALIVKESPQDGRFLEFLDKEAFMETETKVYKNILPSLGKILQELHEPTLWPFFFLEKGRYKIFADLMSEGYVVKCRKRRLDLEDAEQVVKSLALFHAAAIAAKEQGKLDISGLLPSFLVRSSPAMRAYREGAFKAATKTIIESWGPEWCINFIWP